MLQDLLLSTGALRRESTEHTPALLLLTRRAYCCYWRTCSVEGLSLVHLLELPETHQGEARETETRPIPSLRRRTPKKVIETHTRKKKMGDHSTVRLPRRFRIGSRLLCLLSVCAVGSDAIFAESDPTAKEPAYCTMYHHQVKSAGTTVKDKLETASLEAGWEVPGLCVTGPGLEQSCLEAMNGTNPVITGYTELLRGVALERGRQCDYFTVMRHPIDRLVSAFFYCPEYDPQARPKKWCGDAAEEPDAAAISSTQEHLLEFARRGWKNMAFRVMLFGSFPPPHTFMKQVFPVPPQGMEDPGILEMLTQVERILATYTAVGILEHWNLSMDLFNARIRSPVRDWKATPEHLAHLGVHKANPGVESELRQLVNRWARTDPEIRAALATDLLLYDFSVAVFMQQTTDTLGTEW